MKTKNCEGCGKAKPLKAYNLHGKKKQFCENCARGLEHSKWEPKRRSDYQPCATKA